MMRGYEVQSPPFINTIVRLSEHWAPLYRKNIFCIIFYRQTL